MKSAAELRQWEIPNTAIFSDTPGGLVRLEIETPLASAEIYLHGAHVAKFQPVGQAPVLFLSKKSHFTPGKAIRGGVPIIFPWFGPKADQPEAPAHGFTRTAAWELESVSQAQGGEVHVAMRFASSDATRALWPHDFVLRFNVVIGAALEMTLEVENTSEGPFTYENALHTYLTVCDVLEIGVFGLEGAEFIDKVDGGQRKRQKKTLVGIHKETDRLYLNTTATCSVNDLSLSRRIIVEKSGSNSTVVWNPWQGKGMSLTDLAEEWPRMICIETVNAADNAITLAAGDRHSTRAIVRSEPY